MVPVHMEEPFAPKAEVVEEGGYHNESGTNISQMEDENVRHRIDIQV